MLDAALAFLADFWPTPLAMLPLIPALAIWFAVERRRDRERIRRNNAGGLCRHGRSAFKFCRDCAVEFASTIETLASAPVDPIVITEKTSGWRRLARRLKRRAARDAAAAFGSVPGSISSIVAGISGLGALTPGLAAIERYEETTKERARRREANGRRLPLRIDIPYVGPGQIIDLEITTNRNLTGVCNRITVFTDQEALSVIANIPSDAFSWRENLTMRYGPHLRAIMLDDDPGLEAVKIFSNGRVVVDLRPAEMLALQGELDVPAL